LPLAQKKQKSWWKQILMLVLLGGGSGVGITAMIDGTTDIAMASRE
jgi:phosphate transport system substrate-binding protein